jgi:hypothetical protein
MVPCTPQTVGWLLTICPNVVKLLAVIALGKGIFCFISLQLNCDVAEACKLEDFGVLSRALDGSLGHKVYHKPTHTNLYLSTKSHYHPFNKQVVLSTLVHRVRALCGESLQAEFIFQRDVFEQNGCSDQLIYRAFHLHLGQLDNDPNSVFFLPFVRTIFKHISRVLT